jgi:hypothetical protein
VSSQKRRKRRSVGGEARNAVSRKLHQDGSWTIRGQGTHCCEYREYVEQADGKYKPVRRFKSFPGLSERAAHEAMLDAGEPLTVVRDQLRHSDVRITLGVYGHVLGNGQRNAVNRLAKRLIA